MITRKNIELCILAIFLICFGPWSFYTMQLMSESLYMFILILCFYHLEKKNYIKMGIFGALLSATRVTGIFFAFVAIIKVFIEYYSIHKNIRLCFTSLIKNLNFVLGICLIPIGIFSYMLFLQIKIGDGLGFIHSQQYGWHHSFHGFFKIFIDTLTVQPISAIIVSSVIFLSLYLIYEGRLAESIIPLLFTIIGGNTRLEGIQRYAYSSLVILFAFLDLICSSKIKHKLVVKTLIIILLVTFNCELFTFLMSGTYMYIIY